MEEAAPWLRIGVSTLRRYITTGEVPARFVTRRGGQQRTGKLLMTGHQIVALIAYWSEVTAAHAAVTRAPAPVRRRRKAAAA